MAQPAYRKYTLTGLPKGTDGYDRVAQKTLISKTKAYVLQVYDNASYSKLWMADLPTDEKEDSNNTLDFSKYHPMTLKGFGHGQTLELYTYNNTDYFWIGTKGVQTRLEKYNDNDFWGTQLGRMTFQEGMTYENAEQLPNRLTYLTRIAGNTKSTGSIERVEAALTSDTKHLLILTVNVDHSKARLSMYKNKDLNDAFERTGGTVEMDTDGMSAFEGTASIPGSIYLQMRNPSIQGIDVSNRTKNGNYLVYISGGKVKQTPSITRATFNTNGTIRGLGNYQLLRNTYWPANRTETEAVQIYSATNLLLGIAYHDTSGHTSDNYVYRIAKNVFD
ncbi:hypothetical protein LASUN_07400 [Lentilactobacillus sunkii]|jgi:hypothetical protein|uniref:Uncharacterized protein n=1 Tax=Lentilactobacillus sunkii TaxID=481719 RepID=A0A1E7XGN8_9LACO|nr:helveticin J family class III bacteriocin [Lentilactobacillus sunkii]OFA12188.1 hypothetical protein LASUN_07400 [Lentilactobacillus sunkii]